MTFPTPDDTSPSAAPQPVPTPCKLCQFSHFDLHWEDEPLKHSFSRHPDLCDACLVFDFSRRPILYADLVWYFFVAGGGLFGLPIGVIAAQILNKAKVHLLPDFRLLQDVLIILAAFILVGSAFAAFIRLKIGRMPKPTLTPEQLAQEAKDIPERHYYLALWGILTDHPKFARQQFKRARRAGFSDRARLSHPRLAEL